MTPPHRNIVTSAPQENSRQPLSELCGEALVRDDGKVWIPYDRARAGVAEAEFRRLSSCAEVHNADRQAFRLDDAPVRRLLIINGMGIALGDSVIGLGALTWLRKKNPQLEITLWRSFTAPDYVESLYALADEALRVERLPQPLNRLREFDAVIDLADFMRRPAFDAMPTIDFFFDSLGIDPANIDSRHKRNRWLAEQMPPGAEPGSGEAYALFCPYSSASLRSIPEHLHLPMIDAIWRKYGLPVLGFSPARHPHYQNVAERSRQLTDFIRLIRHAALVVTADSAAVHIAAGFDRETVAYFVSIRPALRTRDYPRCRSIHLDADLILDGLHEASSAEQLSCALALWEAAVARLPSPSPQDTDA